MFESLASVIASGFLPFIVFLVTDLVVVSVLMQVGMMMAPPTTIA